MDKIVELINSGFAGMLQDGKLVDRREYPLAIPIQANSLLGVPEPKPVEPPVKDKPKRNATTEKVYRRRLEKALSTYKGKFVKQGEITGQCTDVVMGKGSMLVLKLDDGRKIGMYSRRDVKVI